MRRLTEITQINLVILFKDLSYQKRVHFLCHPADQCDVLKSSGEQSADFRRNAMQQLR